MRMRNKRCEGGGYSKKIWMKRDKIHNEIDTVYGITRKDRLLYQLTEHKL